MISIKLKLYSISDTMNYQFQGVIIMRLAQRFRPRVTNHTTRKNTKKYAKRVAANKALLDSLSLKK